MKVVCACHASAPAAPVEALLQMIRRVEAVERRSADLRHDVAQLRRQLAALQAEQRTLAELRARAVTLLQRLASDLHQLLARLEMGCGDQFPARRPNLPRLRFLRGELVAHLLVSPGGCVVKTYESALPCP